MAVFKRKYTAKNGKAKATQKYSVDFRDHNDIVRRISAFTDKSASLELKRQLEKLVALRMAGAGPDAELSRFLESSPAKIRENLGKWGIIAGERAAAGKALTAHSAEWQESMTADGLTRKQIVADGNKVAAIAKDCGWRFISGISATDMNRWRNERKTAGMALMTLNHYLTVTKTFCNWLVSNKRLTENPLAHLSKLNAATDRRRKRRAFTVAELGRIIAAAEAAPVFLAMTGHERALVYRLAATSGLRWSEIRSLTRASFDFAGETATVTITATYAKNRKEEVLPLRPEVATDLKAQMALSLPTAKTFSGMQPTGGAEMLRFDLEAAGIPYIDEYGRVGDFHALRHTYGTLLNQAGVPLATTQKLVRQSRRHDRQWISYSSRLHINTALLSGAVR